MSNFNSLFDEFPKVKIAVIGDVMLDTYWWGKVDRISPEAPVPIASIQKKEFRIGGAGNVALNTEALLAPTTIFSVIGDDEDGVVLTQLLKDKEIHTEYIIKDTQRPTTNKIRIMGRSQQMMRIDYETTEAISAHMEEMLIDSFKIYVEKEKPAIAILEDYNKGVLTPHVIDSIIAICNANNVFITVDPKSKNFFCYKNVHIFKPNLKEVVEALHLSDRSADLDNLKYVHQQLKQKLNHSTSLITLSERGIFFQNEEEAYTQPAFLRNIADVSGAGDTVIAVASVVFALSKDMKLACSMANIAGGLVCEELGTAVISPEKLLNECNLLLKD
ncbi:bifunctional heptose 7-phosphate kinase/heptose 1-phosphate adenyltransferase [Rhizosphaericola mali]|uniref:Carbohydrate kinase n=1 Tax=Rhizosphaericola mali TaxID=2545455 RepID=A0A5P2FVI9_9BACT|nr:PfkB family carbohydrate kinase [Rhizosphaericola mali]QES87514.1 carbohydrate kinase [Rhizosphaericola mali]